MDTSILRTRRTTIGQYARQVFPVLIALTAGSGMLSAANVLATFQSGGTVAETTVTLNCSTLTGTPPSATIVVKPITTLVSPNQYIVSATLAGTNPSNFVITAPTLQTLGATATSTTALTLTYTVTLAAGPLVGCQGLSSTTTATVAFAHITGTASAPNTSATPTADVSVAVATTVNGGTSVASALTTSVATVNLTCVKSGSSYFPGPAQTVTVGSGATGGTPFALDSGAPAASWVTYPTAIPGSSVATAGSQVTFTVKASSTCGGLSVSSTPVVSTISLQSTLLGSGVTVADKTIAVNIVVSGPGATPLVVIPSPITVTCAKVSNGSGGFNYIPNYPQTVSVTSAAVGGTAFTVGTSAPTWLYIGTPSGGTASASAVTFTLQAQGTAQSTNCNNGVATSIAIHLTNAPNNDAVFSVSLQIVTPTILTAAPTSATFTYVKGSGTAGFADVAITSSLLNTFFTVNDASLPSWLRASPSSGSAPQSIRFSSTNVADTLAPGTYTAQVTVSVSGYGDLTIPVSMLLTNKAAQMTIQGPTTVSLIWTEGEAYPTPTITVLSTDTPIAYVATTGGSLGPQIPAAEQNGLAYSFGTPISVSFSPQAFATASPGSVLTGTVTLTWGSPASTIVVTFDVTVQAPGATISSLSPSTEAIGQSSFTVALTGTGFVQGVAITQATRVGIVTTPGAAMTFDPAIVPTIINGSNMSLQFIYPGASYTGHIPFNAAGSVVIGVCNPVAGVACQVATASQTLYFGSSPIVQAVVSSSSLLQTGVIPTVAPYDMVSIFGSNFCPNCASSGNGSILTGSPDALTLTYPTSLAFTPTLAQTQAAPPIPAGALTVTFQKNTGGSAFTNSQTTANAPLLFANNGQINLLVPSVVPIGQPVDIVVSYTPAGGSAQSSVIYTVNIVATDPGIFTIGADGQGNGAILDLNNNLVSSTNPAGLRSATVTGNSDIVSIYMTGLGIPDSTGDNTQTGSGAWSADCVSPATYLTSFNAQQLGTAIGTLDGTLIVTGPLNTGRLVPCLLSGGTDAVTLSVGGQPVTSILYAGWVPDTIAGLYQVTFRLPDNVVSGFTTASGATSQSITAPQQVPVSVTSDGNTTQTGVSLYVAPRLLMTGPIANSVANTMSVKVGTPLSNSYSAANAVVATGGPNGSSNSSYTYAITSGLLPPGLTMIPSGANGGLIVGTPSANTGTPGSNSYTVTVTATDSEAIPVTGTVTFVVTVGNGLFMTDTTQTTATFGAANAAVTTVTATGGVAPYFYSLSTGYTTATGIAINQTSGVVSTTATTKAGTYTLAVSSFDSGTTSLSTSNFPVVVGLHVPAVTPNSVTASTWSASVPYNPAIAPTGGGNGNTYVYSVDAITAAFLAENSWVTFDTTTGIFTIATQPVVTPSFPVTVTVTDSGTLPTDASAFGTGSVTFNFVIH